ncbi:MAG: nucleoside triphosphate pyrophosphohydrolase [Treponema sp.]|nr:nucleoside triphosphate pyrophosphohydrolase [Treponema sp.]
MTQDEAFKKLYDIVVRLRGPGGCPWDIEQTPFSIRDNLIEETYECVEAINEGEASHINEELGDIFLLVTMLAYMYEQEGIFSVSDVLEGISEKLIRRHPQVFGPATNFTSNEVLKNWARIKVEEEGRKPKDSILDEVSRGLPPLDRAWKLQKKAAKVGFDWPDATGVIAKIKEELQEAETVIATASGQDKTELEPSTETKGRGSPLEEEFGDLLFSVVNLCRFFGIEPSVALQRTNIKFTERFRYVEKRMKQNGEEMNAKNLDVMDQYWNEAKKI